MRRNGKTGLAAILALATGVFAAGNSSSFGQRANTGVYLYGGTTNQQYEPIIIPSRATPYVIVPAAPAGGVGSDSGVIVGQGSSTTPSGMMTARTNPMPPGLPTVPVVVSDADTGITEVTPAIVPPIFLPPLPIGTPVGPGSATPPAAPSSPSPFAPRVPALPGGQPGLSLGLGIAGPPPGPPPAFPRAPGSRF